MRESFVLYTENMEQIEMLSMEQRGILFTAVMKYEREEELPTMDGMTSMCFSFIKSKLDRDAIKYKDTVEKRRQAAASRWNASKANASFDESEGFIPMQDDAKNANASDAMHMDANDADNVPVPVPDNVIISTPPTPSKRFVPPTEEEVSAYIKEKGYHFDAATFVAFYASKGWTIGKNSPMKDWKSACVTWEKRRAEEKKTATRTRSRNARPAEQHDYNFVDIDAMLINKQRNYYGREN